MVLLQEINIMKQMEHHQNIINLLGYCTKNGPPCAIVELAERGNLLDFLRQHKQGENIFQEESHATASILGIEAADTDLYNLTSKGRVNYALQVAQGICYLASKMLNKAKSNSLTFFV